MSEKFLALQAVRWMLLDLAAEETDMCDDGDDLALPPPLAAGCALGAISRILTAVDSTPSSGEFMLAERDIAVSRWMIEVGAEIVSTRQGAPDQVELAYVLEDLAREVCAEVRPVGMPEVAVARALLARLARELDIVIAGLRHEAGSAGPLSVDRSCDRPR